MINDKAKIVLGFFVGWLIATASFMIFFNNPLKLYRVCYYDVIDKQPVCVATKATSYHLSGGCATFEPNKEGVCGVLIITKSDE